MIYLVALLFFNFLKYILTFSLALISVFLILSSVVTPRNDRKMLFVLLVIFVYFFFNWSSHFHVSGLL